MAKNLCLLVASPQNIILWVIYGLFLDITVPKITIDVVTNKIENAKIYKKGVVIWKFQNICLFLQREKTKQTYI